MTVEPSATSRGYLANETIRVGLIGTGSRGHGLIFPLQALDGVQIVAACDVWDEARERARQVIQPAPVAMKDYRYVLDRKDIDAVVIATPDHWHVPMTLAASAAGKDVYVEKPITHAFAESRLLRKNKSRQGRVIQVGMQQRSIPHFLHCRELVRQGLIGKVHKVRLCWNRNCPRGLEIPSIDPQSVDWNSFLGSASKRPFDPYRFREWRWFWEFGGGIVTDLLTHHIDIVHWYLDLDHPEVAMIAGDNVRTAGLWETPDTVAIVAHYPKQRLQVTFEGTFVNARDGSSLLFMGTEGTLYLDRAGYAITPEPGFKGDSEHEFFNEPRGGDWYPHPNAEAAHLTDWLSCIRSRESPIASVEAALSAVSLPHLANHAYRQGGIARWPELENASSNSTTIAPDAGL